MIKHLALAAVAVGLMASPSTASIVIDDFANDTNVGDALPVDDAPGVTVTSNGVIRTLTLSTASANDFATVNAGNLSGGLSKGSSLEIAYDLTGSTINTGFFVDRVLNLGLEANVFDNATGGLDVAVAVASAGQTTGTGSILGITSLIGFDLVETISNGNGHLAALADADSITLTITNNATGGFVPLTTFSFGGQIAAVPEPTSIALLGLTGIGGVIAVRRRRKSVSNS